MDAGKVKMDLRPCKNCGRTFNPESLKKHEGVCKQIQKKRKPFDMTKQRATEDLSVRDIKKAQKKVKHEKSCKIVMKKRKPFDPAKQRVTEDLSFKAIKKAQQKEVKPTKTHWKQKHEEFIRNIRYAKQSQQIVDRGGPLPPPPPPSENPDYVQCPYCTRRFNEKAAERHIAFCKEQKKKEGLKRQPTEQERKRAAAKSYQPPKPRARGDAPGMTGGYGGGYSDSPPPGRGGYSSSPAAGRGGYSSSPAGGRGGYSSSPAAGRGGYSSSPAAGRGGYSSSPASRGSRTAPEVNRGPPGGVSGGYGTRGRTPPGPTRGRPSPSSQGRYGR